MKIDRLLSIIIILLNKRKVTARELAEQFEVTERTIYRDIDTLDRAGIPIITHQGSGGGISLIDGFIMDRQLVKGSELESILTALKGLTTLIDDDEYVEARRKIESLLPASVRTDVEQRSRVHIDFVPFGATESYKDVFRDIKQAMDANRLIQFRYGNANGEITNRAVEPYTLHFKGSAWYLFAYCTLRESYRYFKVNRMSDLEVLAKRFESRSAAETALLANADSMDPRTPVHIELLFDESARARAEELFSRSGLTETSEGLRASVTWPEDEWVYGFILSFGSSVQVISPQHVREEVIARSINLLKKYKRFYET